MPDIRTKPEMIAKSPNKGFWAKAWGGQMNHFWLFDHNNRPLCQPNRKRELIPHRSGGAGGYKAANRYCERCKDLLLSEEE